MYTYKLINNGYEIYKNNRIFIKQIKSPNFGDDRILNEQTSTQMAKLLILKLNNMKFSTITIEEEEELSSSFVSDERLNEILVY